VVCEVAWIFESVNAATSFAFDRVQKEDHLILFNMYWHFFKSRIPYIANQYII